MTNLKAIKNDEGFKRYLKDLIDDVVKLMIRVAE